MKERHVTIAMIILYAVLILWMLFAWSSLDHTGPVNTVKRQIRTNDCVSYGYDGFIDNRMDGDCVVSYDRARKVAETLKIKEIIGVPYQCGSGEIGGPGWPEHWVNLSCDAGEALEFFERTEGISTFKYWDINITERDNGRCDYTFNCEFEVNL